MDFGRGPLDGEVRASSDRAGGRIEFRVDAPDGILVAEAAITPTGGWTAFETFAVDVVSDYTDGTAFLSTRDLYLVFRGGSDFLFDVDAFLFTPADVPATGVEIVNCPVQLTVGEAFTLQSDVFPADAVNQTVSYNSSDADVVFVDNIITGDLIAQAPGTATITVTTFDGGDSDECVIEVVPAEVSATGIEIVNCPFTFRPFTIGDELTIESQVVPENAADPSVEVSSSDPAVVEIVDAATGKLRAVGAGDAFIVVTAVDGGFVDSCEVRVLDVPIDPYTTVAAIDYTEESGTKPGAAGTAVGFIEDGDCMR